MAQAGEGREAATGTGFPVYWPGCAETAVLGLGLLHAAVEIVMGWSLVYCLE